MAFQRAIFSKNSILAAVTIITGMGMSFKLLAGPNAGAPEGKKDICPSDYTATTFATKSFNASNTDLQSSFHSGFQWYRWNWFSGANPLDHVSLNPDSSLTVSGVSGPNGQVTSGAKTNTAPYFVGMAFGGGLCTEAEVSFDPTAIDTHKGFPAYWAMPLEHLNQQVDGAQMPGQSNGFDRFIELDFMEVYKYPLPQYLGTAIDWFGQYRKSCAGRPYCKIAQSFANLPDAIPAATDWNKWHRIGAVWQPAEHGRPGSLQYFFDGRPIASPFTWTAESKREPIPVKGGAGLFNALDHEHLVLILGSNSAPLKIRSIWVRQRDGSQNVSN